MRLAKTTYAGCNDSHLAELLEEREHITLSRASVRRILRGAGVASPRRHRPGRYHARRERRAASGMLVQLDGSKARWFGEAFPYRTLIAAIDDATGEVLAATFREQEDAAGYFSVLAQLLAARGVPLAVYSDRHGIFQVDRGVRETQAEELAGVREPTQLGRAFAELGVEAIFAHSPQAKGRVERLFGTLQDRLVSELRLAKITTLEEGNRFLPTYLPRHNSRFAVAPVDTRGAWRALPAALPIDAVCCFKYSRQVATDNTVRLLGVVLQLPPRAAHWTWSGQQVEVRQHLDGALSVHAPGGRELARSAAPATPPLLRAQPYSRRPVPSVGSLPVRGANSPWRRDDRWQPGVAGRIIARAKAAGRSY